MARLGPLLHNLSQAAIKTSASGEVSPQGLTGEGSFSLFTYFASFSASRAVGLMASTPPVLLQATLSGLLRHGSLLLFFPWALDGRIIHGDAMYGKVERTSINTSIWHFQNLIPVRLL